MRTYRGLQSGIMEDGCWTPHIRPPLSDRTGKAGCCVGAHRAAVAAGDVSPFPGLLRARRVGAELVGSSHLHRALVSERASWTASLPPPDHLPPHPTAPYRNPCPAMPE